MDVLRTDAFIRRLHRAAYQTVYANVAQALAAGIDAEDVREGLGAIVRADAGGGPHFDETLTTVLQRALDDALEGREPNPPFPET